MSDQPTALFLADLLENYAVDHHVYASAAAELRRLHTIRQQCERQYQAAVEAVIRLENKCEDLLAANKDCVDHYQAIKEQRDALLEVLKQMRDAFIGSSIEVQADALRAARAAIAKAEGA